MTDFYLSPAGSDWATGTLADPWQTIGRAVRETSASPTIHLQPGTYTATNVALFKPISLVGLAPGVIVEPASTHSPWTQVQVGGQTIWHASTVNVPAGKAITQATWVGIDGARHRIPVWNPLPPIDTPDKWAAAVLGPNNPHTRWGLFSTSTDLYLIPPADGSWADPNTGRVLVTWLHGLQVNGPGVTLSNLELVGHTNAVRLDSLAAQAHLVDLTIFGGHQGIGIYGSINPITYGHDHLLERIHFSDNGTSIREGNAPPVAGQGFPWNLVKLDVDLGVKDASGKPLLVHKPLTWSESCAILDFGGSQNTIIQDCTVDGYFDGFDSWEDGRYDAQVDTNLLIRRCSFTNITDDGLDRSRHQNNVTFEDCVFRNTGTVLSPAPLWGDLTMRRCTASMVGDQVRIADGLGHKPSGSLIKYGAIDAGKRQGSVTLEDCVFWTDTPSSHGICPDGGDGSLVPKITLVRSTLRCHGIVLNWGAKAPHPVDWLTLTDSQLASSGTRPLKTQTSITPTILTPAATVDAFYIDPAHGDFTTMSVVTDLQAQITSLQDQLALAQQQAATEQASLQSLQSKVQAWHDALAVLTAATV